MIYFQLKLIDRILSDLKSLKQGQAAIEEHLSYQDIALRELLRRTDPPIVVHAVFRVNYADGSVIEGATSVEMKINQRFSCNVSFEDAAGNPAAVDEPPVWSADPEGVLTLEPTPDGMSVRVTSGTKAGSAQLLCKADADMGDGLTEITGMLAVTVLPGDAVTVTLEPGEVENADVMNPLKSRKRR